MSSKLLDAAIAKLFLAVFHKLDLSDRYQFEGACCNIRCKVERGHFIWQVVKGGKAVAQCTYKTFLNNSGPMCSELLLLVAMTGAPKEVCTKQNKFSLAILID